MKINRLTGFNNVLALVLTFLIFLMWALDGRAIIKLDEAVKGALTVVFTLVAQYFFRKAPPQVPPSEPSPSDKAEPTLPK